MRYLRKIAFLALALCLVMSLPLAASAAERTGAAGKDAFLTRVYTMTSQGAPKVGTTRAQYLTILYDAAGAPAVTGKPAFPDVSADAPYASAVVWAEQRGVLRLERGRDFDPDAVITGEEAAQALSAALATLGETAQQLAQGLLAAYSGYTKEEDFLLPFCEATKEPWTVSSTALLTCSEALRISRETAPDSHSSVQGPLLPL